MPGGGHGGSTGTWPRTERALPGTRVHRAGPGWDAGLTQQVRGGKGTRTFCVCTGRAPGGRMLVRGPRLEEQRVRMVTALGEELSASHVHSDSASPSDAQSVSKRSITFRQRPGQRPHRGQAQHARRPTSCGRKDTAAPQSSCHTGFNLNLVTKK